MLIRLFANVACAAAAFVVANDTIAANDGLENIVITGSRISRTDVDSASPIVVVPARMFLQSGSALVERTLNELPQFVPFATGTSNAPSNDGQANISLRGLSPSQTLVLLDGRRLMPADGRGSVDLNVLPPALIERVDVITGGAAAVYGSDAIAGVVNFRIKDAFDGVKVDGGWAETAQGDGEEYTTGLTAGTEFAGGRGSMMGYVGYTKRDFIGQDERKFSRYPLQYFADESDGIGPGGAFLFSGSGYEGGLPIVLSADQTAFRDLFTAYGYASVPYQAGFGVNNNGTLFTHGDNTPGSVVNFHAPTDPALFNDRLATDYDTSPYTALQMPLERTTAFSRVKFAVSETIEAHVQVLVADYNVDRQLAPVNAGITLIPVTNPHIPVDLATLLASRPVWAAPFRYFRRATEVGPQTAENDRELFQITTGIDGQLSVNWTYDAYAQFGRNQRTEQQSGNVSISRLQNLTFAADGGASICGDFNPFGTAVMPTRCALYIAADAKNKVTVDQSIGEVSVSGPLWSLPAGPIRAAFGVFYKKDELDFNADPIMSAVLPGVPGVIGPRPDIAGFEAAPDRRGDESNIDGYVELLTPLLGGAEGEQALDLGLGYRYSDYDHAGAVSSYKAELAYRPELPVRLRGSYQHTVRAPSVEELFYPPVAGQFVVHPDPCNTSSAQRNGPDKAQVEALCLAQGLPAVLLPRFNNPLIRADGVSGGNPDLDPEQADTYTVGLVFPDLLDGLEVGDAQISIDWYRIDIEDGIGRWQAQSAVDRCFDATYNPSYEAQNIYCSFFERRPDTGFVYALIVDRNIGGLRTSGIDLQVDWAIDVGVGRLAVNEDVTYVDEWQYRDPSGGVIEYVGTIGGGGLGRSLPRWKSLFNVDYSFSRVTLFAKWQYIDAVQDVEFRDFDVPSRNYVGFGASYETDSGALAGLTTRVGIENVFDEDPPIFPTSQQANTDPSQYDVLGRRYFLNLSYVL